MKKNVKEMIYETASGMAIGVANIIPGVSGGTIAVILGIYDKLISAINDFFKTPFTKKWYENLFFLIRIAIGAGVAILAFASLISYLSENHAMQTSFFFIGLIVGSIPLIFSIANEKKFKLINIIPFVLALLLVLLLSFGLPAKEGFKEGFENAKTELKTDNSINSLKSKLKGKRLQNEISVKDGALFLASGVLAASAMVIPGISGSFILLLLGTYYDIVEAVKTFNLPVIFLVGIGAILGIIIITKLIHFLLKKYHALTYYAILGLVIASLFKLYPGFSADVKGIVSIICLIAGAALAYFLSANKKKA